MGGADPVADYAGVAHKALIELEGRPLLARVAQALHEAGAARVGVSCNHPAVAALARDLGLEVLPAAAGPSQSVFEGAQALGFPLLVTTADHALLQPEWVTRFLDDIPAGTDVAALVAPKTAVEAAAPTTRRTYLKLADGWWSGCNLFWLGREQALGAVAFWRRLEAERKRPWKMARILGLGMLLKYVTGALSLSGAARRLGELAGVEARVVATPYGLAAVDVDKPADLDLVRELTGGR
ncbi:NTP transferase domain-containing protein [Phenylobacterium sp. J426]|uniref:nucleotidyltransferase family protein n=1 Tax=Phenylobacterium sp. J426 TaxID=2898439 RepID=UPI0027E22203|nr:NTP transferase domain-containing protein [Phenylobacterium sp. J426]